MSQQQRLLDARMRAALIAEAAITQGMWSEPPKVGFPIPSSRALATMTPGSGESGPTAENPYADGPSVFPSLGVDRSVGIKYVLVDKDLVIARLPITEAVAQPFGLLAGAVSVVLAESIATMGSAMHLDFSKQNCVGLDINANHLRPGLQGDTLIGIGKPISVGKTVQVWGIELRSLETKKLICIARCTTAVVPMDRNGQAHGDAASDPPPVVSSRKSDESSSAAEDPLAALANPHTREQQFLALQQVVTPAPGFATAFAAAAL